MPDLYIPQILTNPAKLGRKTAETGSWPRREISPMADAFQSLTHHTL